MGEHGRIEHWREERSRVRRPQQQTLQLVAVNRTAQKVWFTALHVTRTSTCSCLYRFTSDFQKYWRKYWQLFCFGGIVNIINGKFHSRFTSDSCSDFIPVGGAGVLWLVSERVKCNDHRLWMTGNPRSRQEVKERKTIANEEGVGEENRAALAADECRWMMCHCPALLPWLTALLQLARTIAQSRASSTHLPLSGKQQPFFLSLFALFVIFFI